MKKSYSRALIAALVMLLAFASPMTAYARGQAADDCPPGSTDPDCTIKKPDGK